MAGLGHHDGRGYECGLANGLARGVVSPDANVHVQDARRTAGGAPTLLVGGAGVLPRIQRRQRRPGAGVGFVRWISMNSVDMDVIGHKPRSSTDAPRRAPLAMGPAEFRDIGHRVIDRIADRLAAIPDRPVTPD